MNKEIISLDKQTTAQMKEFYQFIFIELMLANKTHPMNEERRVFLENALHDVLLDLKQINNHVPSYSPNSEQEQLYMEVKKILTVLIKQVHNESSFDAEAWNSVLSYSTFLENGYLPQSEDEAAQALVFNKKFWEYITFHYKLSDAF